MPRAAATAAGTRAGSCTAASSTRQAPSAKRPATWRATSMASRVLPTPPGPVIVTSREPSSRPATSCTASVRPTKVVSGEARPRPWRSELGPPGREDIPAGAERGMLT